MVGSTHGSRSVVTQFTLQKKVWSPQHPQSRLIVALASQSSHHAAADTPIIARALPYCIPRCAPRRHPHAHRPHLQGRCLMAFLCVVSIVAIHPNDEYSGGTRKGSCEATSRPSCIQQPPVPRRCRRRLPRPFLPAPEGRTLRLRRMITAHAAQAAHGPGSSCRTTPHCFPHHDHTCT